MFGAVLGGWSSVKILVADDDPVVRAILQRQLSSRGHEVVLAIDGSEACRQIDSRPDLEVLLLDWMMPGQEGPEVCRYARSRIVDHYVYILLITARSSRQDFLEGMAAGVDDFVVKPIDSDELQVRLRVAERLIGLKSEVQMHEELNRRLRELDLMKTAFIFLTSHELRSPLGVLMPTMELLGAELSKTNDGVQELWSAMVASLSRLSEVVVRTLEMSHEGEYEPRLSLETCDATQLVVEAVSSAGIFAKCRSQRIRMEAGDDIPPISVDRGKIREALLNLLMNAIKFSRDGGEIAIRILLPDAVNIQFEVIDHGTGISEADKPHVFEKYFSSFDIMHHSSGSYQFGTRGIGLGLPIVKYFVELHGGSVGVDSVEGQGSRFYFTVPVCGGVAGDLQRLTDLSTDGQRNG